MEAEREAGGQRAGQAQGVAAERQAELLRLELELKGLQADQAEAQASASAAKAARAEALQSQAGLPNHSLQKLKNNPLWLAVGSWFLAPNFPRQVHRGPTPLTCSATSYGWICELHVSPSLNVVLLHVIGLR